jgi:hypothetical protein
MQVTDISLSERLSKVILVGLCQFCNVNEISKMMEHCRTKVKVYETFLWSIGNGANLEDFQVMEIYREKCA